MCRYLLLVEGGWIERLAHLSLFHTTFCNSSHFYVLFYAIATNNLKCHSKGA